MLATQIFKKYSLIVLLSIFSSVGFAQKKYEKHLINNEISINYPDSTVFAEVYHGEKEIKPKIDRYYIWYRANDIKITKGGFDGRLIHGDYIVYYHDKSLKEKGKVNKGQKKGRWIRWYHNGEIYEIMHWKNGLQHGNFQTFDHKGKLESEGNHKNGKLHGNVLTYKNEILVSIKKYKNGVFVEDVEIKEKEVKLKKDKKDKNNKASIEEKPIQDPFQQNAQQQQQNQTTTKLTWKQKIAKPWVWLKSKFKKKEKPTSTPQ